MIEATTGARSLGCTDTNFEIGVGQWFPTTTGSHRGMGPGPPVDLGAYTIERSREEASKNSNK